MALVVAKTKLFLGQHSIHFYSCFEHLLGGLPKIMMHALSEFLDQLRARAFAKLQDQCGMGVHFIAFWVLIVVQGMSCFATRFRSVPGA